MDMVIVIDFLKVFHIFSVIAWMSGLLYLPRIFVYHSEALLAGSEDAAGYFETMEFRLYRYIMLPSMFMSLIFGLGLMMFGAWHGSGWLHVKLLLVLFLVVFHFHLGFCRLRLAGGVDNRSPRFYRFLNEVPAVILLLILFLVVFQPF